MRKKNAFTLAEVLITLGIIGVVAAMTLPILLQKYTNRVVETRLAKFYSTINQAIKISENEYGDKRDWFNEDTTVDVDNEGNPIKGSSTAEKWWNKYIAPNLKTTSIKYDANGLPYFYFPDGSAVKIEKPHILSLWIYYPGNPDKCLQKFKTETKGYGKCAFMFIYKPDNNNEWKFHYNKGVEPYKYNWDGTLADLYNDTSFGCNTSATYDGTYCTALIQYNGWKIPDDYPFKVSY